MGRKRPPPGYITYSEAKRILGPSVYRYEDRGAIKRYTLPNRKQGFFKLSEVEAVKQTEQAFFEQGIMPEGIEAREQTQSERIEESHHIEFAQATLEDVDGIDFVASQLFPGNPSAGGDRRPLLAREPLGNYVIKDNGAVVAYLHIQPLRADILEKFMSGQIRGPQLRVDDLEPFIPGRPSQVLIKGIGAIGEGRWPSYYIRRLLIGAVKDLGQQGIVISRIYATSDTPTGIGLSLHADMRTIAKLGHGRYGFELDVEHSTLPLARMYHQSLDEWKARHGSDRVKMTVEPPVMRESTNTPVLSIKAIQSRRRRPDDTLPDGYISFKDMYDDHGVKETSARHGIEDGSFSTLHGSWYARGRVVKVVLDRENQQKCIEYIKTLRGYHQCKDEQCPCHEQGESHA